MASAKPAVSPFRVNMERIQIPRAKIGGAGRNNPTNQLPVDSPPPRPALEISLGRQSKSAPDDESANNNNKKEEKSSETVVAAAASSASRNAPAIVVSSSPPPPEPAIDYD